MNNMNKINSSLLKVFFLAVAVLGVNSLLGTNVALATATLTLSPSAVTVGGSQIFTVTVNLDTVGQATDGVDIFSLHFNPAVLQVLDDNSGTAGIQITPGTLFPLTVINSVN